MNRFNQAVRRLLLPCAPLFAALVAVASLAILARAADPQRRVYIAPDDHTDYLWTADEDTYRRAFVEMLDYYLDQIERTAGNPTEHQGRWNADGSLWMWNYERSKSPAQFERFLDRVRDGHISVPLNAAVSCYGGMPLEAVLRGMYYSGRMERRHGLRFPLAVAMENQTLPYGLGALWAGAGAKYSWRGICGCASRLEPVRNNRRPHDIYWWQGFDGSRILMKWNTLLKDNQCIGGYAEAFDPAASLKLIETDPRFREAWPYNISALFGKGWDRLTTMDDEVVDLALRETNAERTVIVSNEEDFFRNFEAAYGEKLPAFSAAFGNEWDLYTASVAELAGRVRRAVEKLRTAEALAALVALERPEFLAGREADRDLAFFNLGLFWEHNWTADGPISRTARAAWGRKLAGQIEGYVNALESDASYALAAMIPKGGNHMRFYVFNPLGWTRSDVADLPWDGPGEVRVVDVETGAEVPSQIVTLDFDRYVEGRRYLRILARDIPPVGYRVFEIQPAPPREWPAGPLAGPRSIENHRYALTVAESGSIVSLIDKAQGNREYVRVIGGRAVNDLGGSEGVLTVENAGPVSTTLRADAKEPLARTTRITLYRDLDRIDIVNQIQQNFSEVMTWSFGLNLDAPELHHEEVGAILRAKLTSDGGHYSPVHSRLDWLTLNHFADMSAGGGAGITLSNADLAFMKLGDSKVVDGVSTLDTATPRISVLAGGQVDGPELGIPAQGGDARFLQRFALRTHSGYDATEAMRFALEHQNPLRAAMVSGGSGYPERSFSLLKLQGDDVLLWALKPAEEGINAGLIVRVWNVASQPRKVSLSLGKGINRAARATHIETNLEDLDLQNGAVVESLHPQQVSTYRLLPPNEKP